MDKVKILFVCLGNICRSPAAEGVFNKMVESEGLGTIIESDSAGTYAGHAGELPDRRMRAAASGRGYELTHRARRFGHSDFDKFDMILVMDDSNYENVCRMASSPEALAKVERMTDYCVKMNADHVPDPYYEGQEGFEKVLDLLEDACGGLLQHIKGNNLNINR